MGHPIHWSWRIAGVAWLVTFAVLVIWNNLAEPNWAELYALQRHGIHAAAIVTRVDTANHAMCQYSYSVRDHAYTGAKEGCAGGRAVGDSVDITYLPKDPSVSVASPINGLLRDEIIIDLGLSTFIAYGFDAGVLRRIFRSR